jgi:predicted dehydrogenase
LKKPDAGTYREALEIARICRENGIKAVVSHQQKYLPQMQRLTGGGKPGKSAKSA